MTQQINLYAAHLRPLRDWATHRTLFASALVLAALVTVAAVLANVWAARVGAQTAAMQRDVAAVQEQLAALGKAVEARKVAPALAEEVDKARTALNERSAVLAALESGRSGRTGGFADIFSAFSRQTAPNLWLTGLVLSQGGEGIEIRGRVLDPAMLPGYVQRLGGEPALTGRRFAGLEMRDREPEAERPEAAPAPSATPAARLPRFTEFVLRAEAGGGKTP